MKKELRKSGVDIIGEVPWGTHFCQFYQTKEDLIDILVPYFKAGLENNEFCMWITSEPLKIEEAKASLKKAVKNLDDYIKKGQIEILDYSEWYTKSGKFDAGTVLNGWVEKEERALKKGFDGLRLTGNTLWLEKRDWKKFTEYEATVDSAISKYKMIAICSYCLDKCEASDIMDVVSNHEFALARREGKWEIIESAERKKTEEQALKQAAVLEAISSVFREALMCETEEELGKTCLAVAEKLTGSKFGFYGVLNPAGLMDDIAISNPGWDACKMAVSDARRYIKNMPIRGIDRSTIREGKSRIVNADEMATHPDRVGTPEGHPKITAFLGVPLKHEEKTIGMIGLGNKESGYDAADQEAMENLSVAIVEALRSKQAEEELRKHREHLEELVEERTAEIKQAEKALRKSEQELSFRNRIAQIFLTIHEDETYDEILKVLLEMSDSKYGVFGYIDEKGTYVVPTMTRHIWDKCMVPDKTFSFPRETWEDSTWPRAIREKKTIYSNKPSTKTPEGHISISRHISMPIIHRGEVIGLFQVANKKTDYDEGDIQNMETIARHIAPILNARLQRDRFEKERTRAEEEIKKLNINLENRLIELNAANKELEAFSYSVSHDLRAPLRAIDGFSKILLEDYSEKLDDEGERMLNVIRSNTNKMGELINDLLEFSRVGRKGMKVSDINMDKLVKTIFKELKISILRRKLKFNVRTVPPAFGDRTLIQEVFVNLLSNAIKFTEQKETAVIEVGGSTEKDENIYYVKDNGVGFDMRYVDKLFGVFQRLHTADEFKGTGVGLALVKRIIERHGGRVWAEGKVNEGAAFYFTLPKKGEKK